LSFTVNYDKVATVVRERGQKPIPASKACRKVITDSNIFNNSCFSNSAEVVHARYEKLMNEKSVPPTAHVVANKS
jgi:hypothetical protein